MSTLAGEGQGRGRKNRPKVTFDNVSGETIKTKIDEFYAPVEKIEKKQVSIYLDTDVISAIDKWIDSLPEKKKKGARSDLVNNFLKQVFNIRQGE
ncbi:hypothetical protein LAV92_28155 [Bacillus cereus]|uniref:hypothetical protein n=1 Tax=Bacillus cereus TaxID=1396 RepID=UPI0023E3A4D2|nr:hypothetical protein [Bacillus cereus]MDF3555538.1 hypothetical protein [Bacillus cereus]